MTRILVIEPAASGHRMVYVRHLLEHAEEEGCQITLATTEAARSSEAFGVALGSHASSADIRIMGPALRFRKLGNMGWQWDNLIRFRNVAKAVSPDCVFVPYGNYLDKAAPFFREPFGAVPWSLLTMRESFHHRAMGITRPASSADRAARFLYFRLLNKRGLRRLFTIDELIRPFVERTSPRLAQKITFCYEPVAPPAKLAKAEARRKLEIPANKKVLLIYGQINARKGLDRALECLVDLPDECAALVAGTQDSWAAQQLNGEAGRRLVSDRIYAINRYVDSEIEAACFAAADAVWMGYRNHYTSSGVLTQAAVSGLPVVACQEGVIGYRTANQHLGRVVDIHDLSACVQAVSDCLYMEKDASATLKLEAERLAHIHSPQAFAQTILRGLASA